MQSIPPELMVWTEPLKLRLYDVDSNGRATCASLCWHFLEAAWNHAQALGVGLTDLNKNGQFWVLSRLRIEAKRYPAWGNMGTLRTWPRAMTPLFAMRDFEMLDESGGIWIEGSSAWLVLDAISKRPQRLAKILPAFKDLTNRAVLARDPEKLPDCPVWEERMTSVVRYSDLDVNGHMNSSCYIRWILDSYPMDYLRNHIVRALEINYLDETRGCENLSVRTHQTGPDAFCHFMVKTNGAEVCRARLEWMPIA